MKKIFLKSTIVILPILFSGCSMSMNSLTSGFSKPKKDLTKGIEDNHITRVLLSQYREWKGVEYKYGGNSKDGIDCSAFIQRTFYTKLHKKLPRTTYYQSRLGKAVKKKDAKAGDLVFFKTGRKSRHVGIYLDDGKFLHVSTSKGVIISTLDNVYFKRHFWKIKRVLEDN
ncbi:NlpC/P60 family protein [Arcobacter sp. CECT 8986]|uniref:NlpC/P60 family protein n=1 Tax=Arcobacter sp. CECT 8986 TaxID=2044507 RepID=UPI0013E980C9|nr:NlpC/P60 family protein [Arcobacter sp. CECT 8986]